MDVVNTTEIRCSGGVAKVLLDVPQGMQIKNWKRGKFYESPFLEYLRATYHGGTWVDGGSALGNHTLFMALFCDCERVVSVDPMAESLAIQTRILSLNGVTEKVSIICTALANWSGVGLMERFGPGVGHWRLVGYSGDGGVSVATLDEFRLADVRVLKLDVEGHELRALKGATYLLSTQNPAVFTECNTQREAEEIARFLKQFGYSHGRSFHTMHEWRV